MAILAKISTESEKARFPRTFIFSRLAAKENGGASLGIHFKYDGYGTDSKTVASPQVSR
jgi:hypothetical protein